MAVNNDDITFVLDKFRTNKVLNEESKYTNGWENSDAVEYANKLIEFYGEPTESTSKLLFWDNITPFKYVYIMDESIPHRFPEPHRDYVYSTIELDLSPYLVGLCAYVTGSIIVDGLKNEVTARCGTLYANAVTLGFVEDLKNGNVSTDKNEAKDEYARRITEGVLPEWYENELDE